MVKRGEFIAEKINEAISKGLTVDENLLSQINKSFNKIVNDGYDKRGTITDMRIIEYRKNRINTFRKLPKKVDLGYKDESYFSESEMLLGYVAPNYEDLSKDEQLMYDCI